MKPFKLKIVTPNGIYFQGEVEILNIRTTAGQLGILANHLPLACVLEIDEMNFTKESKKEEFAVGGGFVYVDRNETTIIANTIESRNEIDLDRALEAKKRAEERLKSKAAADVDLVRAEMALKKSLTRINLKQNY